MCRVFGWVGEVNSETQHRKIEALLKGLILAEEKGNPHGTGLVVYSQGGGHQIVKKGLRGSAFLIQGYADVLRYQKKMRTVIGHVRFKTAGEQSDKNAHPFGFRIRGDWYFGMHNGIIGCADQLAKKYGIKGHAVDSATFFFCLAKVAEKKSLVESIEEVTYEASSTGDFAFAIMRNGEIYLWRNDARPLAFFDLRQEGLGRVFCSTKAMFEKAVELSGVSLKNKIDYFEAKPYRLYKIGHRTSPLLEVEVVKDLKHKEKPKYESYSYSWYSGDSWLKAYDRNWLAKNGICCSSYSTPSLFESNKKEEKKEKKEKKKEKEALDEDYDYVSALTDEQLQLEILETEAEVHGEPHRKDLKAYLQALYEEWNRRSEEEA